MFQMRTKVSFLFWSFSLLDELGARKKKMSSWDLFFHYFFFAKIQKESFTLNWRWWGWWSSALKFLFSPTENIQLNPRFFFIWFFCEEEREEKKWTSSVLFIREDERWTFFCIKKDSLLCSVCMKRWDKLWNNEKKNCFTLKEQEKKRGKRKWVSLSVCFFDHRGESSWAGWSPEEWSLYVHQNRHRHHHHWSNQEYTYISQYKEWDEQQDTRARKKTCNE